MLIVNVNNTHEVDTYGNNMTTVIFLTVIWKKKYCWTMFQRNPIILIFN